MAHEAGAFAPEEWISELASLDAEPDRRSFLARQPQVRNRESVQSLYDAVVTYVRIDVQKAERLAQASSWIAEELKDLISIAQSARATGHVLYITGKYKEAIREYERALEIFEKLGRDVDVGRTINGALQSLIYDGQYQRAFQLVDRARTIFLAHNDRLRLARLDSNMANIYYRQDRFHEAAALYEKAHREFLEIGEALDVAAVLRNLGTCYISLNEFSKAQEAYQIGRQFSQEHGFSLFVAEADYNVAYLHYLRGEYLRAIELYDQTRVLCEQLGDRYHRALCDLDESEIYLELNLTEGGEELARAAFSAFTELNMRYEAAKAATFSAIAISQQGHYEDALLIFDEARELFTREHNQLWPALIDLYKALVLYEARQDDQAEDLAASALEYFGSSLLPAKAAVCELLLAAIEIRSSDPEEARRYCSSAFSRLLHAESPASYQAYFMLGQAEESSGNTELARQAYDKAYQKLEDLRNHLGREELKIAFLKNKLAVYEGLVVTSLAVHSGVCSEHDTFAYIEQAKSRSLADLISFRSSVLSGRSVERSPAMAQFRELHEKLNWTYHQIELEELNQSPTSRERIRLLREHGRSYEDAMVRAFSQLQNLDRDFAALQCAKTVSAKEIQKVIPANTLLVEFYAARNTFYACLVSQTQLKIIAVADVTRVREKLRLLQLQLAKFRLGEDYIRALEKPLLEATLAHLEELYGLLIAPLRKQLHAEHLVIVPHSFLHYRPFHALPDGERYLIDDFTISYAPSARIVALCQQKPIEESNGDSLVLAVADARAPHIEEEGRFVAEALGKAHLFLGEEATEERLKK